MSRFSKMLEDLPLRLRAAAEALARNDREREGYSASTDHLGDMAHQPCRVSQYVEDARAALDAAEAVERSLATDMLAALRAAKRLVDVALPAFDWGKSALSGEHIQLLNEAPIAIETAINRAEGR